MSIIKINSFDQAMRKKYWFGLMLFGLMSNCNPSANTNTSGNELLGAVECSIKIGDVTFTKSMNNAKALADLQSNKLLISSPAKSDYFNEPDGKMTYSNAPLLLTKINNAQPFTFQLKVTPTFKDTYDAGALYIYQDEKRWFKFAFERDERQKTRIVTVRTSDTSDDNNHDVADSATVYMKISSDVKTIGFYYSLDNLKWQLVRLFKNEYPTELWLGVSAQSPIGEGNQVAFEECLLTRNSVSDFRMGN
jgi:uncharacterized protein